MDQKETVFDFSDYKLYLSHVFHTKGPTRGLRSALARTLGCQTAFISQVLHGHAHFSLEHAIQISEFLKHDPDESHFFLLLVHSSRAGSRKLTDYYLKQINQVLKKRQFIRERIHVKKTLSKEDHALYYSAWYYSAIHIILSIPQFQTKTAIAEYLQLPIELISKCLEFLVTVGLATQDGGRYTIQNSRIHLDPDSPLISKHHTNWRMKAIQSLDTPSKEDLHYSSVISLSERDLKKIRTILLEALEKTEPILKDSKEEGLYGLSIDLFRV